jgi:high affinity sulfate transporter 1
MSVANRSRSTQLRRVVPGISLLRTYKREWFRHDLVAGLVLTTLLVPQGMAYAGLAGLPPETGLYTTAAALLAYALFGPSRILVVGPDSTLAPIVFATLVAVAGTSADPARAMALAGALAILMGLICIAAGFAKLGIVAELLSKPVRLGFLNGVALIIIAGQLPKLVGFASQSASVPRELWSFAKGLAAGDALLSTTVIGLASLAIIVGCRHWAPRVPGVALAVVGSIATVGLLDLQRRGVVAVGTTPHGFPRLALPNVSTRDLGNLIVDATGLAFLALADTSPVSRALALKRGDHVDSSHEMVAIGASNIAAGLFHGFAVSGSASRTAVAETNGARTQLTGVIGSAAILAILIFANDLMSKLAIATLAAILISAAFVLADLPTLVWLAKVSRVELALSLVTTIGVAWLGPMRGLGVAVALSVIDFLRRAWRPHSAVLGRIINRKGYHDLARHPDAVLAPGLVLFRFDAPLFFANADHFAQEIRAAIDDRPEPIRWVVLAAEPITDIDTTAAEMLGSLLDELDSRSVTLVVAEMKGRVKDRLRLYGLADRIGEQSLYPTIGSAMKAYYHAVGLANPADDEATGL